MSEDLKVAVYIQLNRFIAQMPAVAKSGTNTFFKSAKNKDGSKYSTLEDCLAVLAGSESSKSIQDFGLFLDQRNEFVAEHKMPGWLNDRPLCCAFAYGWK